MNEDAEFDTLSAPVEDAEKSRKSPVFGRRFAVIRSGYGTALSVRVAFMYVAGLVVGALIYDRSFPGLVAATALFGWSGYRVQFVLHEASHRTLFPQRNINDRIGSAFGLPVGVNLIRYRWTHLWHHRQNGRLADPQFPDYLGKESLSRARYLAFILSPLLGGRLLSYLGREMGDREVLGDGAPTTTKTWWLGFLVAQTTLSGALWRVSGHPETILLYFAGLSTISLFLSRLRTLAEHQQVVEFRENFSRSHRFNLVDWLLLYDANFNYHLEHHLYPGVQSGQLATVHRELAKGGCVEEPARSMFGTLLTQWKAIPSRAH